MSDEQDRLAQKALEAFFDSKEVEWRVGATSKDKTKAIALPYVSPKTVTRRLDAVLGANNWSFELRQADGGFIGRLSMTFPSGKVSVRENFGANSEREATGGGLAVGSAVKGGASDALKRAAVLAGIARYFDDMPVIWVPLKEGGKQFAETPKVPAQFQPPKSA
ncbi:MAG: Rad52/Rad22 family DNA repair protein [Sinobacteraceae bacterium]|nr:Rad52/Rad22 family DNA repair protein [Nevskiaceae bacterium]